MRIWFHTPRKIHLRSVVWTYIFFYYIIIRNQQHWKNKVNTIIKNTLEDDNKFVQPIIVYFKFKEIDESKVMHKEDVYKLIIWCLDWYDNKNILKYHIDKEQMKIYEIIKKGFFQYCEITQKGIDLFLRQILIEQGNTPQKIDSAKLYTLSLAKTVNKDLLMKML